jgi:subtilisin family serine protease
VVRRLAGFACLALAAGVATATGVLAGPAADPGRGSQWALDQIGATTDGGAGITVAVVDTGVDLGHVDLRDHLVPGIDLVDGDDVPQDANGHGTHVAGIVAASAGNGAGVAGVAPGASIMPVRVLDADGSGTLDDVVAGIRWAVDHGASVLNLSLSEDAQAVLGPSLSDALRDAWSAGVVPVVAAGNQYVLASGFAEEPAIVVAATTRSDTKPSYSSGVGAARWGMAAPGGEQPVLGEEDAILSTYWVDGERDQYAYDCGTSMAAPHVAGAVAVLLGLGLSPQDAVDRVLATAKDIGQPGRDDVFGAGRLDLAAASDGIDPVNEEPAPEPAPTTSAPASPTTTAAPPAAAGSTPSSGAGPGLPPTVTVQPAPPTTSKLDELSRGDEAAGADEGDDDDPSTTVPAIIAGVLAAGAAAAGAVVRRRA